MLCIKYISFVHILLLILIAEELCNCFTILSIGSVLYLLLNYCKRLSEIVVEVII